MLLRMATYTFCDDLVGGGCSFYREVVAVLSLHSCAVVFSTSAADCDHSDTSVPREHGPCQTGLVPAGVAVGEDGQWGAWKHGDLPPQGVLCVLRDCSTV